MSSFSRERVDVGPPSNFLHSDSISTTPSTPSDNAVASDTLSFPALAKIGPERGTQASFNGCAGMPSWVGWAARLRAVSAHPSDQPYRPTTWRPES